MATLVSYSNQLIEQMLESVHLISGDQSLPVLLTIHPSIYSSLSQLSLLFACSPLSEALIVAPGNQATTTVGVESGYANSFQHQRITGAALLWVMATQWAPLLELLAPCTGAFSSCALSHVPPLHCSCRWYPVCLTVPLPPSVAACASAAVRREDREQQRYDSRSAGKARAPLASHRIQPGAIVARPPRQTDTDTERTTIKQARESEREWQTGTWSTPRWAVV